MEDEKWEDYGWNTLKHNHHSFIISLRLFLNLHNNPCVFIEVLCSCHCFRAKVESTWYDKNIPTYMQLRTSLPSNVDNMRLWEMLNNRSNHSSAQKLELVAFVSGSWLIVSIPWPVKRYMFKALRHVWNHPPENHGCTQLYPWSFLVPAKQWWVNSPIWWLLKPISSDISREWSLLMP